MDEVVSVTVKMFKGGSTEIKCSPQLPLEMIQTFLMLAYDNLEEAKERIEESKK